MFTNKKEIQEAVFKINKLREIIKEYDKCISVKLAAMDSLSYWRQELKRRLN